MECCPARPPPGAALPLSSAAHMRTQSLPLTLQHPSQDPVSMDGPEGHLGAQGSAAIPSKDLLACPLGNCESSEQRCGQRSPEGRTWCLLCCSCSSASWACSCPLLWWSGARGGSLLLYLTWCARMCCTLPCRSAACCRQQHTTRHHLVPRQPAPLITVSHV
jgi:hypothetical protein